MDALVPRLRERAAETEEIRRIPEASMAELKAAGVFQMLAPKAVGGFGMGLETYVEVVRRLAQGCVSTAWSVGHLVEHVWMLARWPQEAQDEVFANGPAPWLPPPAPLQGKQRRLPAGSPSRAAGASPPASCTPNGHSWPCSTATSACNAWSRCPILNSWTSGTPPACGGPEAMISALRISLSRRTAPWSGTSWRPRTIPGASSTRIRTFTSPWQRS
nr:acyl-CoA dehydrogenase family protein [Pseudarthrobacter psychrotolerans]